MLPTEASVRNPLDMIATATPATYRAALAALLADDGVDSVVAIFVPPLSVRQEDVAEAIVEGAAAAPEKPVLAVLMGRKGLPQGRAELWPARIPAYVFPESAARALAALVRQREWLERPVDSPPFLSVDRDGARKVIDGVRTDGRTRLNEVEALQLLAAYGIPSAGAQVAATSRDAARLVEAMGAPAVMKIVSPDVIHKTDVGGVETRIRSPQEATTAHEQIIKRVKSALPNARITGVLVQRMAATGRELIVGLSRDPQFGPMIMFGLGGVYVEALRDVVFRVAPLTPLDAREMTRGIRGRAILHGIRGQPPILFEALEGTILRVAQLATDLPDIVELDINPLIAYETGVLAVDARVKLKGH
jgi:acetyltransferase